ncbi:5-formyltetrahydrofolate cyclo-ligase [Mycoplasma todarodis]|uniref:5-formyltetrahydrofolate cyclo-ligase n=1 Tax=Mycoplasma todarodis TaxID=1937191 RepID=A0A4R0XKU5_9MOLU|nr:5-formyltetrahydrofolate cyclo-ligase [Mycoplasma todarodis]TCG11263.1 5-formyltetrahydrofolate cyclo-ligase [Mycoplasma todarodis]
MIEKQIARKNINASLRKITSRQIDLASKVIVNKCKQLPITKNANTIAIFSSMEKEVQTKELIEYLLKQNKRVVLPYVIDEEMVMLEIKSSSFKSGEQYKTIKQPSLDHKIVSAKEIELIFVPCVGFDSNGNRLGRGKGFYDRFLKRTSAKKVLLALEVQRLENFKVEKHDVNMDVVITEQK